MAARVNQRPVQVDWDVEPVKEKIKMTIGVVTEISASCLKGPVKEACRKTKLGPAADCAVEVGLCVTTAVVKKGLEYAADKCLETPESMGSRCLRKMKK